MIAYLDFAGRSHLNELYEQSEAFFLDPNDVYEVHYPEMSSKPAKFYAEWQRVKKDIVLNNEEFLSGLYKLYGVYGLYTKAFSNDDWSLKYIGHTHGDYARARLTSHLIYKNIRTGSKLDRVKETIREGGLVGVKFLQMTTPEVRLCVECELIKRIMPDWNIRGLA